MRSNDPCCKHYAAESGLPLGALGPFAAQESIKPKMTIVTASIYNILGDSDAK
jgi:hypothetical protein